MSRCNIIRDKNGDVQRNSHRVATIQTDTYCNTGCSYCFLANRKKNPANYGFEKLTSFLSQYCPDTISMYGADTFYDVAQSLKLANYVTSLPYVKHVSNVSELSKLERDMDTICTIKTMCDKVGKSYSTTFSTDLFGVKSYLNGNSLVEFARRSNADHAMLNCVVTVEQIMTCENFIERIEEVNKAFDIANSLMVLKFRIIIDFSSSESYVNGFENKAREFFKAVRLLKIHTFITGKETTNPVGCPAKNSEGVFIDINGVASACSKTLPLYEIDTCISVVNCDKNDADRVKKSLSSFKQYNNDVILKKCKSCMARDICNVCPKYVHLYHKDEFKKDNATCQYFKTLYEFKKEERNSFYRYIKTIARFLKITKY